MKVTTVALDELVPDPRNARTHDERNLAAIQGSLERFGQVEPLVVRAGTNVVVGGNGRLEAMRSMGWEEASVTYQDLTDEQAIALGIALNRTAELAAWDNEQLADLLEDLSEVEGGLDDLEAIGFNTKEMERIVKVVGHERNLNNTGEPKEKDLVVPKRVVTQRGDVWEMGQHRLLCGDCRDEDDVDNLLGNTMVNLAISSPPYASQRKYDEDSEFEPIAPDEYVSWFTAVQSNIRGHMAGDGSWFLNIKEHCEEGQRVLYVKDLVLAHVRDWGWRFVDEFAWTHNGTPKAVKQRFKNGWEPVFQFAIGRHKFNPLDVAHKSDSTVKANLVGGKHPSKNNQQGTKTDNKSLEDCGIAYPSNVLPLGLNRDALGHPAAFPVLLPEFFIKAYSDEGDSVYDPFLGSGTTIVAAERTNRIGFGLEISPGYCDVIVERWENLTGQKARRIKA